MICRVVDEVNHVNHSASQNALPGSRLDLYRSGSSDKNNNGGSEREDLEEECGRDFIAANLANIRRHSNIGASNDDNHVHKML